MSERASQIPRLTTNERLILDLLREGELFGLQLVARSEGTLKRGTVYVTLRRMLHKGYIRSRTEPLPSGAFGLPRRWYCATEYGLRVCCAWTMAASSFAGQRQEIRTDAA